MSTPHNDFKHTSFHQYGYPSPYNPQHRPELLNQSQTSKANSSAANAPPSSLNANPVRGSRAGSTPTLNQLLQTSSMDPRYTQHNNFASPKSSDMMNTGQQYSNPAWSNVPRPGIPPHMQQYRHPVNTVPQSFHYCSKLAYDYD